QRVADDRRPQPPAATQARRRGRRGRTRRQWPHRHSLQPSQHGRHRTQGGAAGARRQVRAVERAGPFRPEPPDAWRRPGRRSAGFAVVTGGAADVGAAHLPVMFEQVMEGLRVVEDGTYLDGTFGRGGHARGVLQRLGDGGRLLLMDKDPEAIAVAEREFGADARVAIRRGSFADLGAWEAAAAGLDGVLLDLGVSSPQLDVAGRGFSFGKDGPLDMRMDPDSGESAAQWLARADEREIADVLWTYGEERMSRRIARAIVAHRATRPFERTTELAELIASVMPRGQHHIHPATRSFQAIRIHVNRELEDLERGLDAAHDALRPGGRLAVI